jgi:hypothetical protein
MSTFLQENKNTESSNQKKRDKNFGISHVGLSCNLKIARVKGGTN